MIQWICNNYCTVLICLVLLVLFIMAFRHIIKTTKSGGCVGCDKSCCNGNCCHCNQELNNKNIGNEGK